MDENKKLVVLTDTQIKTNAKEQDWYKGYCKCLSYLASLNVESWKDIDKNKDSSMCLIKTNIKNKKLLVDGEFQIVANTKILGVETAGLIKLLNDMCGIFNIKTEEKLKSNGMYYPKSPYGGSDFLNLPNDFKKRLKIVSDKIREKFKISNSGSVEAKLSDDQLFELISQTQKYKEYDTKEQEKEHKTEQKAIDDSKGIKKEAIPIKESNNKNINETNNQKINDQRKDLEEAKKQEEADDWIEIDTAYKITDQIWYCNYMDCLPFLANLNVENSNDITAVTVSQKNENTIYLENKQQVFEVHIQDSKLPEMTADDFRSILYNLFCSLGIESSWQDCYTDSQNAGGQAELLRPWKLNLKVLADTIREKFKYQIKHNGKLSLDHMQLWKIISKTPMYKKESNVVFKDLIEEEFKGYLDDLKNKKIVPNSVDDIERIAIIQAVKNKSGWLGKILDAAVGESYKVIGKETFDVFLDIIQELKPIMEKFLLETKEKRAEVENKVSDYSDELWKIFNVVLRKTLKEKVSWEQWKRFAELGCIDDKNYFFGDNPSKLDNSSKLNGRFFMTRKDSLVDISEGKELSKENVLAWIRDALNTVVQSQLAFYFDEFFGCLRSNWDISKNEIDFSNILNFSDVYAVMREVKFFEYILQRILLTSVISDLDIFDVDKLDLTEFVDCFCEKFSKIQGFNLKPTEDSKKNMLQDLRSDTTKVLLENGKVQKWLKDNENTQNEEDKKRRDKILAFIETARETMTREAMTKESNQKTKDELEKLFNEKLKCSDSPSSAFGNAGSTIEWIQEFKNNIVEICKKTSGMELKVVDQGMFDSFLGIVQNLQTKKMNDFSKEEIQNCYDTVWSLWNDNIKNILSEKISWEQWASFIEAFSIDNKNYFAIDDYRVIPSNLEKFVDVTIDSKESALDFLEKAFSLVTKANLTVIDIGHVESFIGILLDCMKFNPNSQPIDLSILFNADEFYDVLFYDVFKKTGLFKYVLRRVLVSGDALPQTFEQLNNLVSDLAAGICESFNGFTHESKDELKKQMLSDFRSDMFEVLLFDEQFQAEIEKRGEDKLNLGKSRSETVANLRDEALKELVNSNLESDQKQKNKYEQWLKKATTEKKTEDEKIENEKKEKEEEKKKELKVIKQVEKKDDIEDQLKKQQNNKNNDNQNLSNDNINKNETNNTNKNLNNDNINNEEQQKNNEGSKKPEGNVIKQYENANKDKTEEVNEENNKEKEKERIEKELKEKKDREGQLKEQQGKNSDNQGVINMARIESENTEEDGNKNQEKDEEKEEEANEKKRGENSVEEKKKECEKELEPTVSTIKVNENIADNLEKNGKGNESKRGNTTAKVLFFVFLVPSIGFPIVAIVLSNPWLLLGLGFIVPTGICGYFGFKSLKQNGINLGGGNNPYDKDNADSTMNSTITNAKIKQGTLSQFEPKNVSGSKIKGPTGKYNDIN